MSAGSDPGIVFDPLGQAISLPLCRTFYLAGFPVAVKTNSQLVLEAACDAFHEYEPAFETPPVELRVIVRGDENEPEWPSREPPNFAAQGHLLALVLGPANYMVCDMERCFCFGYLTPGVARNRSYTSFNFIEGAAWVCLEHRYLSTVHAACVAREGRGILLLGSSGAGKSSLAWACAKAGFTFVSDDGINILRDPQAPLLIGHHKKMRFRADAQQLIPELAQIPRTETRKADFSFEIQTERAPGIKTAPHCEPWKVVFLDRQARGAAELIPVSGAEAMRRLLGVTVLFEPRVAEEHRASLKWLLRNGALQLRYSALEDAVEKLLALE